MANIKKFKLPPFWFETKDTWLLHRVCTFNHELNVTDDLFEYKLTRTKIDEETEDLVIYNFKVSLDTLKNHPRFCDQSYWTFNPIKFLTEQQTLISSELLSIFDISFPTKRNILVLPTDTDYVKPIRIFVPSVNSKFTDCLFLVLELEDLISEDSEPIDIENPWDITFNTTVNSPNTVVDEHIKIRNVISTITSSTSVSSPAAGDLIPVSVTCSNTSVSKVYLEPVVGIVDRTEVVLTNGSGSFNIITNGLTSGDTVRIKLGHKKYSNVATFTKILA
jgi:hypothetical protein